MPEGLFKRGSGLERALNEAVQKTAEPEAVGAKTAPDWEKLEKGIQDLIDQGDKLLYKHYGVGKGPAAPELQAASPERLVIDENGLRLEVNDQGRLQIERPGRGKSRPSLQAKISQYYPDRLVEIGDLSGGINVELGSETMETTNTVAAGENATLGLRQRLIINEDQSYILTVAEDGYSRELVRETVRPSSIVTHNQEDGQIVIEGGLIKGEGESWLLDNQPEDSKIVIEIRNKKAFVDGKKVKGTHQAIKIGEETVHLMVEKEAFEFLNQAVFEAMEAKGGKEKAAKKWEFNPSEFFKAAGKEAKIFGKMTFGFKNWQDLLSVAALGASELGGPWGLGASGAMIAFQVAIGEIQKGQTKKEIRAKISQLFKQAESRQINSRDFFEQLHALGLKGKEAKLVRSGKKKEKHLVNLSYERQTALGKLWFKDAVSGLNRREKNLALAFGVGLTSLSTLTARLLGSTIPVFGNSVAAVLASRTLFRYLLPRGAGYLGRKIAYGSEKNIEVDAAKEAKAKEWTELTLGAMSTTLAFWAKAGFATGLFTAGFNALTAPPVAHAAETPTAAPTEIVAAPATGTATQAEVLPIIPSNTSEPATAVPTIPPTEAPTEVIPPTEVVPPTPFGGWHPGAEVNDSLLDQATAAGHQLDPDATPLHVNLFGRNYELFRFDLDQKVGDTVPEVWAVKDANTGDWHPLIWEDKGGQFAVDVNGDGLADGWVPQADLPHELLLGGRGGGGEAPRLDFVIRDLDLNNDGKQDILPQINPETGKEELFIDRNDNGLIDAGVDAKIQIHWTTAVDGVTQIAERITFENEEDKSYWVLKDKTTMEYEGFYPKGNRFVPLELREAVGGETAVRQGVLINTYHQLYSPKEIGDQAWLRPESVTMPTPQPQPTPLPLIQEQVTETSGGSWHYNQNDQHYWAVKADGSRLVLGPDGGVEGVLEKQFYLNDTVNPPSPDDAAVIAHRVALENKEAFAGPIGDGSRVTQAMATNQTVINSINENTNIVAAEHFLENHRDWLWNRGLEEEIRHLELSPQQRYWIAQRVKDQWASWLDDNDKRDGLLAEIKKWEDEND